MSTRPIEVDLLRLSPRAALDVLVMRTVEALDSMTGDVEQWNHYCDPTIDPIVVVGQALKRIAENGHIKVSERHRRAIGTLSRPDKGSKEE